MSLEGGCRCGGVRYTISLDELSPQALSIMQTAFARAGLPTSGGATLRRPGLPPLACPHVERPPLAELHQGTPGQASA